MYNEPLSKDFAELVTIFNCSSIHIHMFTLYDKFMQNAVSIYIKMLTHFVSLLMYLQHFAE